MDANHIIEQGSCFYYPEVGIPQVIKHVKRYYFDNLVSKLSVVKNVLKLLPASATCTICNCPCFAISGNLRFQSRFREIAVSKVKALFCNKMAALTEDSCNSDNIFGQRFSEEEAEDMEEEDFDEKEQKKRKQEAEKEGMVEHENWEKEVKNVIGNYITMSSVPDSTENDQVHIPKDKEAQAKVDMWDLKPEIKAQCFTRLNKSKEEIEKEVIEAAYQRIEEASKATCLVRRVESSKNRKEFYEKQIEQCNNEKEKSSYKKLLKNWKKRGTGTGLLVSTRGLLTSGGKGLLVITNNHVIMDEEEAKSAEVYFDYDTDITKGQKLKDVFRKFKVKKLMAFSLRTQNSSDYTTLDYSLLLLDVSEDVLSKYALDIGKDIDVLTTGNDNLQQFEGGPRPLIMFSHPRGLAKRLSIGKFPILEKNPVAHTKHELATSKGCSGGNLLFCPITDSSLTVWKSAFVHYRHGLAVGWQSIKDDLEYQLKNAHD